MQTYSSFLASSNRRHHCSKSSSSSSSISSSDCPRRAAAAAAATPTRPPRAAKSPRLRWPTSKSPTSALGRTSQYPGLALESNLSRFLSDFTGLQRFSRVDCRLQAFSPSPSRGPESTPIDIFYETGFFSHFCWMKLRESCKVHDQPFVKTYATLGYL